MVRRAGAAVAVAVVAGAVVAAPFPAAAEVPPNSYQVFAGPAAGGGTATSPDEPLELAGVMANHLGSASYLVRSGPGRVSAQQTGGFQPPGLFTPRFGASLRADSENQLVVTGPGQQVQAALNARVDSSYRMTCPYGCWVSLDVRLGLSGSRGATQVVTDFHSNVGARTNTLGLDVIPTADGYRLEGDVQTPVITLPVGEPVTATLSITATMDILADGSGQPASWSIDFDQMSFPVGGPVLDLPDGYTASGVGVVDNQWGTTTPPPPPPPAPADDLVVTDCDDPAHATVTTVAGDLVVDAAPACDRVSFPALTEVGGDVTITDNEVADLIDLPALETVEGSVDIIENDGAEVININDGATIGGDLTITDNDEADAINVGGGASIGGDLTITDNNGAEAVNVNDGATIGGDLTITDNDGAGAINVNDNVTTSGEVDIIDNDAARVINMSDLVTSSGTVTITGNDGAETISMSDNVTNSSEVVITDNGSETISMSDNVTNSGEVVITDNDSAETIGMSNNVTNSSNVTITDNGSAVVGMTGSTTVSGELVLEGLGDHIHGSTAGGSTDVTALHGQGSMRVQLPEGTFRAPVGFAISRVAPDATGPETGEDATGEPVTIDPVAAHSIDFDVPALDRDATLSFEIVLDAMDAATRQALLDALAEGSLRLATKGDAPGSKYQAFELCVEVEPAPDGCVVLEQLDASGAPTTAAPASVRFTGVTGHFSTWAVAVLTPVGDLAPVDPTGPPPPGPPPPGPTPTGPPPTDAVADPTVAEPGVDDVTDPDPVGQAGERPPSGAPWPGPVTGPADPAPGAPPPAADATVQGVAVTAEGGQAPVRSALPRTGGAPANRLAVAAALVGAGVVLLRAVGGRARRSPG